MSVSPSARPLQHFKLKTLSLMVALALPGIAFADKDGEEAILPTVNVTAGSSDTLGARTEGTQSYTTGRARTATPLSLSLRETPQSVTVVTSQRIEDQNLHNITDALNNVTGVSVNQFETDRAQFTARGFNINSLMIDGVPTTWDTAWTSGEVTSSLVMYDRVEVVRGATGLTAGAGQPSASINLVRKRAKAQFGGSAELELGSWNQTRATFDIAAPLNAARTVRTRVVGEYKGGDSFTDRRTEKTSTIFATFEADLSDNTVLSAGYSRQENDPRGAMWGGLPVFYADGSRTNWDRSKSSSADWVRWNTVFQNTYATLEHRLDNDWAIKATYSRGEREANSYLLYLMGAPDRNTGLGMTTFPGSYQVETSQNDFGLQASGPLELFGREHELALGYVSSRQQFDSKTRSATPGVGAGTAPDFNNWNGSFPQPAWGDPAYFSDKTTRQDALYGAMQLNITDPLKVLLGLRVSNFKQSGDDRKPSPAYQMEFDRQLTPYAGITYDLTRDHSVYASYTSIFLPQQLRDINGNYLDPIKGNATEAGVKSSFFAGRLNTALSVFHIKQNKLGQSTGQIIAGTVPPETAYRTSSGATSKGFELEVSGEVSTGWNVSAGYSQFKLTDASGKDINTLYPRKLLRLFTSYRLPVLNNSLTVGGGVNWQSETYTLVTNPLNAKEKVTQGSYALVNLMARYDISKQFSAQLNVNNVFDQRYYGMFDAIGQITYGAPRSVSVSASYKF